MESDAVRISAVLVTAFLVLAVSSVAQSVIEPVVFALFVIALIWPMQKAFQSRLPKSIALFLTVLVTLAVIVALSSITAWGGGEVADWLTQNLSRIQEVVASSTNWLEAHDIFVAALVTEHFNSAWVIGFLRAVAIRANILAGFALIVFIYVVMGVLETDAFRKKLAELKDEETARRLLRASEQTARKLRKYILVRTIASIATGLLVWGFIRLMGLELAAAWGALSFALNYLPYIGPLIVTVLPALFAFVQSGSFETGVIVFIGLGVIQLVIGNYLEPLLTGSALGISPSVVVFAVLLWTYLWGAPGAFIGLPLAIAFLTVCENFPSTRWIAEILSGDSADKRQPLEL